METQDQPLLMGTKESAQIILEMPFVIIWHIPSPLDFARRYREMLEVHAEQLANLQETQQFVLKELHSLSKLAAKVFASDGANSIGSPQKD